MRSFAIPVLVSIFLFAQHTVAEYEACGTSDVAAAGLDDTVNSHVTRLMALRSSSFGWENTPEITHAIQHITPHLFNNMELTMGKLEAELRANGTSMSLGKFSQYLLAVKAACKNLNDFGDLDLITELEQRMENEFTVDGERRKTPQRGWYGFYTALGATCVSKKQLPSDWLVHRAIHSQNEDGSFDPTHSVDHTAQAMLGLTCLIRLPIQNQTIRNRIEDSLNLASVFLKSKVKTERDNVWIGNEYSTPTAVLAIKEHSQWGQDAWRCRLIMRSLNRQHEDEEGESAIAQRLLALKGKSFLALLSDDYICPEPRTSDTNGQVIGRRRPSHTCESEDDGLSNYLFSPTLIDIHISIHARPHAQDETAHSVLLSRRITLVDVKKGKTLLEMMIVAQCRGLLSFETETSSWGEFFTGIDGVIANSDNKEYWAILNNGASLEVGVGQFKPSHGDRISFKLRRWH